MTPNSTVQNSASIVIRDISGPAEMRAVEQLQKDVWGLPDLDVVPLTQLVAATAAGGVLIGAFDGGSLAGFAYGFVGLENGRATLHSHMLAVAHKYRNLNIGYRLKLAQRDLALAHGITEMTWTFDPLQGLNAHFNFNRLGVVSDRYLLDFYGSDAASFLHRNGTDRLWVTWPLASRRVEERIAGIPSGSVVESAVSIVVVGADGRPLEHELTEATDETVVIEIPGRVDEIEKQSPKLAGEWRMATRRAFTATIEKGYVVDGFTRDEGGSNKSGSYHLTRGITLRDLD